MTSLADAPTLPIPKATVAANSGSKGPSASAGPRSSKNAPPKKQYKAWADYTPTYTPTPWGDGMPPYAFPAMHPFMGAPPDMEQAMWPTTLYDSTPTPSGGGAPPFAAFRPDLIPPPAQGGSLAMQKRPEFHAMAATAAAAAASAAAAAANACEVNAAASGDVDQWPDGDADADELAADQVGENADDGGGLTAIPLGDIPPDRMSRGSQLHGTGKCRPCAWFWKPSKCTNEADCVYCHLCPEGELKARKKAKVQAMRVGALMPAAPLRVALASPRRIHPRGL